MHVELISHKVAVNDPLNDFALIGSPHTSLNGNAISLDLFPAFDLFLIHF